MILTGRVQVVRSPISRSLCLNVNRQICTILLSLCIVSMHARAEEQIPPRPNTRTVSVFGSIGALEFISLGVNIQASDRWSFGLVGSAFMVGGKGFIFPAAARGIGIRGSYHFSPDGKNNFLWANIISADVQYLLRERREVKFGLRNPGGIGIEAVVGRDCAVGRGIGILWAAGLAISIHSEFPPLVTPAVRVGFHVDM